MEEARARHRSAQKALFHWLRLVERQGSLVRAFTTGSPPRQHQHYPPGDLVDPGSGTQCFYHCHRDGDEHGHLHLFRRRKPRQPLTHLIGVSLDGRGLPLGLFTVNRWVSEDRWRPAAESLRLLEGISLGGAACDPHLSGWLVHFLRFYRPTLETVLEQRDQRLHQGATNRRAALEARDLEIPSYAPLDWAADLAAAEAALQSVEQTEARAQTHPDHRSEERKADPKPTVQAGGGNAGQIGTHVAAEGEPGPVAHQQPAEKGGPHRSGGRR